MTEGNIQKVRRPSVDPKSFELAEHFLADQEWHNASEDHKWELAGVIQRAVEDWLDRHAP